MDQISRRPDANEPQRWFDTPHDIVESPVLSQGQKYLALQRWQTLIEARLRKSCSPSTTDIELHQAIIKARRAFNSPPSWRSFTRQQF